MRRLMSKKNLPKYQYVERTELNQRIDELLKVREDIRKIFSTPLAKMNNARKMFMLQELDEYETYLVRRIAMLKGVLDFSEN